ncbi:Hypothetical protein CINCED_3A014554 [Cinara cedri]|uniref:DUF8207 domain-containing protein n=1 Tax=Cinara cedri TaxID=506608 RepID=A0A5E4M451_9HEMI|nr:Hypothetical protein CINCED_3A014554 [Cinara cedri]
MKRGVIDTEYLFNEAFKPIIDSLNLIADKKKGQNIQSLKGEEDNNLHKTSVHQFTHFFEILPEHRIYDKTYYEKDNKKLQIGEYPVEFVGDSVIVVDNHKYNWTYGLWSLLSEKKY